MTVELEPTIRRMLVTITAVAAVTKVSNGLRQPHGRVCLKIVSPLITTRHRVSRRPLP
jgi:hypothetical protein